MNKLNERQSFETLSRLIHEVKMERAMVDAIQNDHPGDRLRRTTYVYENESFRGNKTVTQYSDKFYKIDEDYELKK
jgi:hypothetical protein